MNCRKKCIKGLTRVHFAYYTPYKLLHKNSTTPLYSQRKYIIRTFVGYTFFSTSVTPFVTPFVTPMQFSCKTKSTVLCTFRIVVWRPKFRPSEACRLWDIYRTQPMSHKWLYFVHTYARVTPLRTFRFHGPLWAQKKRTNIRWYAVFACFRAIFGAVQAFP